MDPLSLDVIKSIQDYLSRWNDGGSASCRKILLDPHSNPLDPRCNDVLTTVYHALIVSTLATWSSKYPLTTDAFIVFVQSVLDHVPSSSVASVRSSNMANFGELLVDIIWSIDSELEEVVSDTKVASVNAEQGSAGLNTSKLDLSNNVAKVIQAKQNAEADKATLTTLLRRLLGLGVLDADVCRERLDISLVANVGLIADKTAFERKEIRSRTGLFYKQNKFNLLREQSEGYSKLTAELTSCLGPPSSPATGYPVESLAAIEARARPAWERVVGLIGYFDLDPNRALDIVLDIFSTHLATHHAFFISFLSFSPWSASSKERHADQNDMMTVEPDVNQYRGKSLDEVLRIAEALSNSWASGSPQEPSRGSHTRVLAQVLGFKFSHYQTLEVPESTPRSLFLMTAILIREGFITLEDVYVHISPSDDAMADFNKEYLAKIEARISAAKMSQLAMAAPLESDSQPSNLRAAPIPEPKQANQTKEVPNQKLGLLNALLSVGALRPAVAMLSKFPWLVNAFPEIADLMLRVLKHSLVSLYESNYPPKGHSAGFAAPRVRYGPNGIVPAPERKPHLTLCAPTPPNTSTVEFVYFFPDWKQQVPLCATLDDLVDVVEPLMHFVDLHIYRDISFFTKLIRLGRTHLGQHTTLDPDTNTKKSIGSPDLDHPVRSFWFRILRRYALRAMPLVRGNPVFAVEVWNLLKLYDTTLRWQLYGEWKSSIYKSHPELRARQVLADRETKAMLRRVTTNKDDEKDNAKDKQDVFTGAVAKMSHSDPCILFGHAINQVMGYSNMGVAIVHAVACTTRLSYDVLVYITLDALANPNRPRVKDDGVNTSSWLLNLAAFLGNLFRQYILDLTPALKYIAHQLHGGQTSEIFVLRELIFRLTGIQALPSLTEAQIAAMAGGPILRIEAIDPEQGSRLKSSDISLKGPQKLGKALLETHLALPLLIQIAQQRQACVFQAANTHVKSLASLFDGTHTTLLQYLDLLNTPTAIPPQDYRQRVLPSLTDLHEKYGICAPICMLILRPTLSAVLLSAALAMEKRERIASEEAEKRLRAALTAKREPNASSSRLSSPATGDPSSVTESPSDAKAGAQTADMPLDSPSEGQENPTPHIAESPWLPQLHPYFDEVKKIVPANAIEVMGPAFYLTFWQLSSYDLAPPHSRYEEECTRLRKESHEKDTHYNTADRSSDKALRQTAPNLKEERNRLNLYINLLGQELKEQTAARSFTIKRLAREKHHWFSHNPKPAILATSFIEYCLQPRCLMTPMDADYCVQFIRAIHSQGTPGFSTLMCYDKILGEHVKVVVFSCSEYEAKNYGRLLSGILTDANRWYEQEDKFLQENRTKNGGYLPGFQRRPTGKSTVSVEELIPWHDFKQVVRKWHRKLGKSLLDCIESGEYMHVYNAIIVLKEILPVFPLAAVYEFAGGSLSMAMERLLEKEKRSDLKIVVMAYLAQLKKDEKSWAAPKAKPIPSSTASRPTVPATNGTDKTRIATPPVATPAPEVRRLSALPASTPSAPRAQLASLNGTSHAAGDRPNSTVSSTKLAMDSVPKPDVVKRVRTETRSAEAKHPSSEAKPSSKVEPMNVDYPTPRLDENATGAYLPPRPSRIPSTDAQTSRGDNSLTSHIPVSTPPKELPRVPDAPTTSTSSEATSGRTPKPSPQVTVASDQKAPWIDSPQIMPPPSIPSQTPSAQELRETAKQSRSLSDKMEERQPQLSMENRGQAPPTAPSPSSRRRTPSPPSRPGTRNPSAESRASGGRRSNRGDGDRTDEKRSERDTRQDSRDLSRRESLSHIRGDGSTRRTRDADRDKESERDRDRDRGRDRHGDRDRGRDRDRERERDRDKDRDRDRDRDRERDRDRDRDRHRRDEKDRDRDSRKERDTATRGPSATTATPASADDRGLPTRPDLSRHRPATQHSDESLGKRRRPTDEESDRSSKRSSRKDSHHEDRSRRSSDKDSHDRLRESDRRRKDRDAPESESRSLAVDTKFGDKRIPDGPSSAKSLPPTTPSAPRAMASGDSSRGLKADSSASRDRDWKGQRDQPAHAAPTGPSGGASTPQESGASGGSLRSRLGVKEPSLPQAPSSYRPEPTAERKSDTSSRDDERDGSRKRTLSERDKDGGESMPGVNEAAGPPKRPRINRNRYPSIHGVVKSLLPDPQGPDKNRAGRNP